MSSQSLAKARAKRAGENIQNTNIRPNTSIRSQPSFSPQQPQFTRQIQQQNSTPNNIRISGPQSQNNFRNTQTQIQQNTLETNTQPFSKISISDAIGLTTIRLSSIEKWIYSKEQEDKLSQSKEFNSNNNFNINNDLLQSLITRIEQLENQPTHTFENLNNSLEDNEVFNNLRETVKKITDDMNKNNLSTIKFSEQILKFTRELNDTKDLLKSFIVKYDNFVQETNEKFGDIENAFNIIDEKIENNFISDENVNIVTSGLSEINAFDNIPQNLNLNNDVDNFNDTNLNKKDISNDTNLIDVSEENNKKIVKINLLD